MQFTLMQVQSSDTYSLKRSAEARPNMHLIIETTCNRLFRIIVAEAV